MTIDKSLKTKGRLVRSRNVLKRHERIEQMQKEEKWSEDRSPLGLPKTRVLKSTVGKKKKKAKTDEEAAATPAAAPAAAAAKGGKK
jgi:small basic protein (TIGR04137 family)